MTCKFTSDRRMIKKADAVLFFGHNTFYNDTPSVRYSNQHWVFVSNEPPAYAHPRNGTWQDFDQFYNWTVTNFKESDFHIGFSYKRKPYVNVKIHNHSKQKSKMALMLVSNCQPKLRLEIAKKISTYFPVDIYGRCGLPDPCLNNTDVKCLKKMFRLYKFYLAFENDLCANYITEKFWRSLDNDMIPIVLGPPSTDYKRIAPNKSFISVEDYSSLKELADYILYLDKNTTAYEEFFEWKKYYDITVIDYKCNICLSLHAEKVKNQISHKLYNISTWYSRNHLCRNKIDINY